SGRFPHARAGGEWIRPPRGHCHPPGRRQGGRRVALRWRIRHKLLLGLGVVVGIIALLLLGTLQGLAAFNSSVKTADSKLMELNALDNFMIALAALSAPRELNQLWPEEEKGLRDSLKGANEALDAFEVCLH